jgi:hypothetical protein
MAFIILLGSLFPSIMMAEMFTQEPDKLNAEIQTTMEIQDARLVASVKRAVAQHVQPEAVEAVVGMSATINTIRQKDRLALQMADIGKDAMENQAVPPLNQAKEVVYWVRPLPSPNPRIVGIYWLDGAMNLFFGVVYPP